MIKRNLIGNRIFKTILVSILTIFFGVSAVLAEEAPSSLTMKYRNYEPPVSFPQTFHIKETTDGKYVYCMTYARNMPIESVGYKNSREYSDAGTNYILKQGAQAKTDKEYFVAQTALWIYLMDKGRMDYSESVATFKNTIQNSSNSYAKQIRELVSEAKVQKSSTSSDATIKITSGNVTFTVDQDNKYYTSSAIVVESSSDDYKVELLDAPEGASYTNENGTIVVKVPVESINNMKSTFKVKVSLESTTYRSYEYTPSNSKYQTMAATYPVTKTASDSKSMSLVSDKVVISKQDITSKQELPGATLVVKDKNGNVIDTWVSTNTSHEISNLAPGEYTLTETIAPDGYELSTETITFTVGNDGVTTKVVMYNTKKELPAQEVEVPSTGSYKTVVSSMIGLVIIATGSVLVLKNFKKKHAK